MSSNDVNSKEILEKFIEAYYTGKYKEALQCYIALKKCMKRSKSFRLITESHREYSIFAQESGKIERLIGLCLEES